MADYTPFGLKPDEWLRTVGLQNMAALRDDILGAAFTQPFGPSSLGLEPAYAGYPHFHMGTDLVLSSPNGLPSAAPVRAMSSGIVTFAGTDPRTLRNSRSGYGNMVVIKAPNGFTVMTGHLSSLHSAARKGVGYGADEQAPLTKPGDVVYAGQIVGFQGTTGASTGAHVHLEIRDPSGVPVDAGRNVGNVLGSLFHGLGLGGGYNPTHELLAYEPPPPDKAVFQMPVPVPLLAGPSETDYTPKNYYPKGVVPPPPSTFPTGYEPPTVGATGDPLSGIGIPGVDPFAGIAAHSTDLVIGGLGAVLIIVGLIAIIMETSAGKKATQVVVQQVKSAGKDAAEAAVMA